MFSDLIPLWTSSRFYGVVACRLLNGIRVSAREVVKIETFVEEIIDSRCKCRSIYVDEELISFCLNPRKECGQ